MPGHQEQDLDPEKLLQHLDLEPASYDLIWIQWVLLYLTDEDLCSFLRRAAAALCRSPPLPQQTVNQDAEIQVREEYAARARGTEPEAGAPPLELPNSLRAPGRI